MVNIDNFIFPEGGLDLGTGVVFFYKSLPDGISITSPVLIEKDNEVYAIIDNKVGIPVEKIPIERFINEGGNRVFLAQMNSEKFMAEIKFCIELQKNTLLDLFGIIKAKNLLNQSS